MPIVFSKLGWNRISGTTAVLLGTRLSYGAQFGILATTDL